MNIASASDRKAGPEIGACNPVPKLRHHEVLDDDRESPFPHQGQVRLGFTIDSKGQVHDVQIVDSTDTWFNELSIQTVLRWQYNPPIRPCHGTALLKFTAKD